MKMGKRGVKARVQLPDEARRLLTRLVWLLNGRAEELLQEAIDLVADSEEADDGDRIDERSFAALEEELAEGERDFAEVAGRLSRVQGRYAAVKLKLFHEFQRNRPLVVNLAGALAENRRLRQTLGLPDEHADLERELDHFFAVYIQRDLQRMPIAEGRRPRERANSDERTG